MCEPSRAKAGGPAAPLRGETDRVLGGDAHRRRGGGKCLGEQGDRREPVGRNLLHRPRDRFIDRLVERWGGRGAQTAPATWCAGP